MKIKNETFFLTLRNYLQIYLLKNRGCSQNTVKSYTDSLNLFFCFMAEEKGVPLLKMDWGCFSYDNVSAFLIWLHENRGCSRQTQLQRLTAIRSFIQYAGIADLSLVALQTELTKIKLKKPPQKPVSYLSEVQLSILLRQPDPQKTTGLRDMVFMMLMYDTAARCQEMVDLRLQNLELNSTTPCVYLTGKGSKTRVVPIMPKTVQHLKHYLKKFHENTAAGRDAYLFYTVSHGQRHRMSEDTVAAFMKKYGLMAKEAMSDMPERVHPHMLRHTRAMHLYQGGMPMVLLSDLLGHAQLETTRIYAYADTEMKKEAIERANGTNTTPMSEAIWKNDEEMIRKLTGLR